MLGLTHTLNPRFRTASPQFTNPRFLIPNHHLSIQLARPSIINIPPLYTKSTASIRNLVARAEGNNGKGKGNDNDNSPGDGGKNNKNGKESEMDGEMKSEENRFPRFNLNWVELLLDPDPNNIAAVGLTGLLTWASVQVLWQLVIVSVAILVAALKYSFIAALLLFIFIALL